MLAVWKQVCNYHMYYEISFDLQCVKESHDIYAVRNQKWNEHEVETT